MNNRFYLDDSLEGAPIIDGSEFHHLVHVMRGSAGDEIELVNGRGDIARARIEKIDKKSASLRILQIKHHPKPRPS